MSDLDGPAPATAPTHTAVIVPVPAAEPLVGPHRRRLDRAAGWGVPAHLTVLYPFLPPGAVTDEVLLVLSVAVSSVPAFDCTFTRTGRFGADFLWLAPEPEEPLRRLTTAVWRAFPEHPPYGGAYQDIRPHLTVAERALAAGPDPDQSLATVDAEVRAGLPLTQPVEHVLLVAGAQAPRSWRTLRRFPLGPRQP